ncbi:uncharacterized protein LOC111112527 isoform X2 [Crassostrea virginica]
MVPMSVLRDHLDECKNTKGFSTETCDEDAEIKKCLKCSKTIPVCLLRKHVEECQKLKVDEDELPKLKKRKVNREGELVQKVDTRKTLDVEIPSKNENAPFELCPICGVSFPISILVTHASSCREAQPVSHGSKPKNLTEALEILREVKLDKLWTLRILRKDFLLTSMECLEEADERDWQLQSVECNLCG